ncbi:polyprenyl synthetase family protein [bacterium]|nr:polyprenyl synthetase family protein [bacterium]
MEDSASSFSLSTSEAHSEAATSISVGEYIRNYPGMAHVESLIRSKFTSDSKLLTEIPEYLLHLGGKRIRPALALITHALCAGKAHASPNSSPAPASPVPVPQPLLDVAAGIELIHMATLLHDDIIDRSPIRRGQPSPHIRFGETATLLTGDFLLVRAFSLCSRLDEHIVNETEEACVFLTEGEILEVPLSQQRSSREESLCIAEKKTAALFGLAAFAGAHVAGSSPEVERALKSFGLEIGIAFQILDDVLDVTADENLLGKRCGGDLIEQKPSIINVLWLESGDPLAEELLLTQYPSRPGESFETGRETSGGGSEDPRREQLVQQAIREFRCGTAQSVVAEAKELASSHIARAEGLLEESHDHLQRAFSGEPESPHRAQARQALEALLKYTVKRLQ